MKKLASFLAFALLTIAPAYSAITFSGGSGEGSLIVTITEDIVFTNPTLNGSVYGFGFIIENAYSTPTTTNRTTIPQTYSDDGAIRALLEKAGGGNSISPIKYGSWGTTPTITNLITDTTFYGFFNLGGEFSIEAGDTITIKAGTLELPSNFRRPDNNPTTIRLMDYDANALSPSRPIAVPEPSMAALLALGASSLFRRRRNG